jgi:predicted negative regulator of RcsB-dependent stress response
MSEVLGVISALGLSFAIAIQTSASSRDNTLVDFRSFACYFHDFRQYVIETVEEEHTSFNFTVKVGAGKTGKTLNTTEQLLVHARDLYGEEAGVFQATKCLEDKNMNAALEILADKFDMALTRVWALQREPRPYYVETIASELFVSLGCGMLLLSVIWSMVSIAGILMIPPEFDVMMQSFMNITQWLVLGQFLLIITGLICFMVGQTKLVVHGSPYFQWSYAVTVHASFIAFVIPGVVFGFLLGSVGLGIGWWNHKNHKKHEGQVNQTQEAQESTSSASTRSTRIYPDTGGQLKQTQPSQVKPVCILPPPVVSGAKGLDDR